MSAEMHPSHDWVAFGRLSLGVKEGRNLDDAALLCRRCEVCNCHSPELSAEPCEYAPIDGSVS